MYYDLNGFFCLLYILLFIGFGLKASKLKWWILVKKSLYSKFKNSYRFTINSYVNIPLV